MKTVIEMAREAGCEQVDQDVEEWVCYTDELERFAELVRADAIADEREACAKVADRYVMCDPIAKAIRARSSHEDRN